MKRDSVPEIDPQLQKLLNLLQEAPPRQADEAARGRRAFLAQIDSLPQAVSLSPFLRLKEWFNHIRLSIAKERRTMATVITTILSVLVILFGGGGAAAYASQDAVPGDALYSVKSSIEDLRLAFTWDGEEEFQIHLSLADRRLDDMATLLEANRLEDAGLAAHDFQEQLEGAMGDLHDLYEKDPALAEQLKQDLQNALANFRLRLQGMAATAPQEFLPIIDNLLVVIDQSEINFGIEESEVGDDSDEEDAGEELEEEEPAESEETEEPSSEEEHSTSSESHDHEEAEAHSGGESSGESESEFD